MSEHGWGAGLMPGDACSCFIQDCGLSALMGCSQDEELTFHAWLCRLVQAASIMSPSEDGRGALLKLLETNILTLGAQFAPLVRMCLMRLLLQLTATAGYSLQSAAAVQCYCGREKSDILE